MVRGNLRKRKINRSGGNNLMEKDLFASVLIVLSLAIFVLFFYMLVINPQMEAREIREKIVATQQE